MQKGKKMKKICIYNDKGGVGKTTSVINIAYAMHKNNKKVLVVDCDRQKNCFSFFSAECDSLPKVIPTAYENISNTTYSNYNELSESEKEGYDYILFDLPPNLTDTVVEILNSSDKVYVPLMLRQFELSGLVNITEVCNAKLGGIFVVMHKNKKQDNEILEEVKNSLGNKMMKAVVPYAESVINSQRELLPLEVYFTEKKIPQAFKNCWRIADAYNELATEIMEGVEE